MRNEEIAERLATSTIEGLQEELDYAIWAARQAVAALFGPVTDRQRESQADWLDYADQVRATLAARRAV